MLIRFAWVVALLCCFGQAIPAETASPAPVPPVSVIPVRVPSHFFYTTYRIKASLIEDMYEYSSTGSGVGVDLSAWGYEGKRFLITAAHVVTERGKICDSIQVEIRRIEYKARAWLDAKVVTYDEDVDLAILVVDADLPYLANVAMEDKVSLGDVLLAVGAPRGTAVTPSFGVLTSKEKETSWQHPCWWQGSMPIFFGNSGGPVWDFERQEVIGIAVAVTGTAGKGIAPNVSFFVGQPALKTFLTSKKTQKAINKHQKK